ncbi:LysR family transcriptional regulator [Rhizobium binxianense]
MDWDNLRIFLAVARSGSVAEAARLLEIDHSTVSRRLAHLETMIGIRLFDRAGRRLRINEAGERLQRTAEKLESHLIADLAVLETMNGTRSGTVRIGAPEGLGVGYLARRLGMLCEQYPQIELELIALPQDYSLAAREADIAITLDRPKAGNLAIRKLTDYELRFFGTETYRARHGWPERIGELPSHRLCGYIPQLLHTDQLDYLNFDGLDLRPGMRSTSIVAQLATVASGQAIGILPSFMAAERPECIPILDGHRIMRSYWLSIHDDLRGVERIRLVADALAGIVREDRALFLPA